ncbi:glycerophosphodiester phosphodiesterase family protein [Flavobacterium sp. PL12]|uniref:glycerophosphodiester phosphodiesterase n=1 Tax=Flavobacterium sp. PL12 TaxID=3071718 RepID=UPI00319E928C
MLHLSRDGEIIVIHDETVDRTTNGTGLVNALSFRELKALRINEKYQVSTLREVFELVNQNCFINIELKTYETADKVVELIEEYVLENNWNYTHFLISSFDWNALQQVRFLNDEIQIGVLTETDLELALAFAKFIQAKSIHPHFHLLNNDNVSKIQKKGIQVFPWTVNELEDIAKIKGYNVNGIITDFPNRI